MVLRQQCDNVTLIIFISTEVVLIYASHTMAIMVRRKKVRAETQQRLLALVCCRRCTLSLAASTQWTGPLAAVRGGDVKLLQTFVMILVKSCRCELIIQLDYLNRCLIFSQGIRIRLSKMRAVVFQTVRSLCAGF